MDGDAIDPTLQAATEREAIQTANYHLDRAQDAMQKVEGHHAAAVRVFILQAALELTNI